MRLTDRDVRLVRDVALSHVLGRNQILSLGYFGSVGRLNSRLGELVRAGFLKVLELPFGGPFFYHAGPKAATIVGERIAALVSGRRPTPHFVRHALAVTDIRIALIRNGCADWRFEPQCRYSFRFGKRNLEIRPDGLVYEAGNPILIEADLGHVSKPSFAKKIAAYEAFVFGGESERVFPSESVTVMTVTTGNVRRASLARLVKTQTRIEFRFVTFADLGIELTGGWS